MTDNQNLVSNYPYLKDRGYWHFDNDNLNDSQDHFFLYVIIQKDSLITYFHCDPYNKNPKFAPVNASQPVILVLIIICPLKLHLTAFICKNSASLHVSTMVCS